MAGRVGRAARGPLAQRVHRRRAGRRTHPHDRAAGPLPRGPIDPPVTHRFEVWAPNAKESVEVEVGGDRLAMAPDRERDGWYTYEPADELPAGTEYRFVLDGGDALPDPRSLSQPS